MCAASAGKRIFELLASKNTEALSISVVEVFYKLPGPTLVAMSSVTVEPGKEDFIPTVIYYFSTGLTHKNHQTDMPVPKVVL